MISGSTVHDNDEFTSIHCAFENVQLGVGGHPLLLEVGQGLS